MITLAWFEPAVSLPAGTPKPGKPVKLQCACLCWHYREAIHSICLLPTEMTLGVSAASTPRTLYPKPLAALASCSSKARVTPRQHPGTLRRVPRCAFHAMFRDRATTTTSTSLAGDQPWPLRKHLQRDKRVDQATEEPLSCVRSWSLNRAFKHAT